MWKRLIVVFIRFVNKFSERVYLGYCLFVINLVDFFKVKLGVVFNWRWVRNKEYKKFRDFKLI